MSDEEHPDVAAVDRASEPDLDRGVIEAWAAKAISNPERAYKAAFYTATFFFLLTTLFPFYWLFMVALTPRNGLRDVGVLTPGGFNPGAFIDIFTRIPFHRYIFNSFLIATVATVIVLFVASLAGYVFGRLRFRGRNLLLLAVLVTSFFPPAAFFVPLNRLFNTNVDVLRPLMEAGSLYNTPYAIFIPLSAPGVATAGVLTFITVYNEYFFSSLMTDGRPQNWAPMLEGILRFQGEFEVLFNLMAAASIVAVLPVAILVIVAQEKIVSGLTAGGLKE